MAEIGTFEPVAEDLALAITIIAPDGSAIEKLDFSEFHDSVYDSYA